MTEKEIKKLNRRELIEMLLYLRKELDETKAENERLTKLADESKGDFDKLVKSVDKMDAKLNRILHMNDVKKVNKDNSTDAVPVKSNNRNKRRRAKNSGKQEDTTA